MNSILEKKSQEIHLHKRKLDLNLKFGQSREKGLLSTQYTVNAQSPRSNIESISNLEQEDPFRQLNEEYETIRNKVYMPPSIKLTNANIATS